jgi:hypothetical protein
MTKAQSEHLADVFAELHDPNSHLHYKIVSDLRSGSVLVGKTQRNNPAAPESDLDDALAELYIYLCRVPWPWTMTWSTDPTFHDEGTATIVICKLAALQVLTNRRVRTNRHVIEADLHHHLLTEGNALLPNGNGNDADFLEVQDSFTQADRLDVHSTQLIPSDPAHKSFADYRKTTTHRALCHPERGHYAKGWCQECYSTMKG